MENRDRILKQNPLLLVATRKSLKVVAECLSDLDSPDADRYLDTLIEELQMLRQRDISSMAWGQVINVIIDESIKDNAANVVMIYGLERNGFIACDDKDA